MTDAQIDRLVPPPSPRVLFDADNNIVVGLTPHQLIAHTRAAVRAALEMQKQETPKENR